MRKRERRNFFGSKGEKFSLKALTLVKVKAFLSLVMAEHLLSNQFHAIL